MGNCILGGKLDTYQQFQPGGKGFIAFQEVKDALKNPSLLQKCTWQQVLLSIRSEPNLDWLSDALFENRHLHSSQSMI